MAMTGTSLIADVRERLNDVDEEAYDDDVLLDYLNDAMELFAVTTGATQTTKTITADASQSYTLAPATFGAKWINIFNVTISTSTAPLHFAILEDSAYFPGTAGTPTGYTVWGDTITFDYAPATGTITCYITYAPEPMANAAATPDFPEKWRLGLVAYAEYRARTAEESGGEAERAYAEFEAIRQAAGLLNQALMTGVGPN